MILKGMRNLFVFAAALLSVSTAWAQKEIPVDPGLHIYQRVDSLGGTLRLNGSETISQLAGHWMEDFRKLYPGVSIKIEVQGARNAVPAVVGGQAEVGLLSREITAEEVQQFQAKFGYPPTVLTPAGEAIAIFVHKDNPIQSLTLAQLDAIYSTTLKRGAPKAALTWGDVGVQGNWASQPIACQGRGDDTGSQVYFQRGVLGGGQFRPGITSHESNLDMVKAIGRTPTAIGFAGAMYDSPDVKAIPLAWKEGAAACDCQSPNYPLLRPLQLVVNKNPQQPLSPLEHEFIKYLFSRSGQQQVMISGFVPIPARPAEMALNAIEAKIPH